MLSPRWNRHNRYHCYHSRLTRGWLAALCCVILATSPWHTARAQVGAPYTGFVSTDFSQFFNWAEVSRQPGTLPDDPQQWVLLRPGGFMEHIELRLGIDAQERVTQADLWLSPAWAAQPDNDLYVRPLVQAFFAWALPEGEGAVPALWPGSPVAEVLRGNRQSVLMPTQTLEAAAELRTCLGRPVLELRVVQAPKLDYNLLAGGAAVLLPAPLLAPHKLELAAFDQTPGYAERRYVSQSLNSRVYQLTERVEALPTATDARSRFYAIAGQWSQGRCPLDLSLPQYATAAAPLLPLANTLRVFGGPPEGGITGGVTHGFSYLAHVRNLVVVLTVTGDQNLQFADGALLLHVLLQRALGQ